MSGTSPKTAGARLGPEYRKLWVATAISTLGDGMCLAALPLLAAQLTRDPLAVSAVTFASWLPWLLVALASGALVDRWYRRRVLWTVDLGRCALVGALAVAVLAGWAGIWLPATIGFSAFRLIGFGPAPVGALLGGVLGRTLGLRAPFVFGAAVLAVTALLALPAVNTRSVEAARVQARAAAADGPA
jgi:MFS family permease